MKKTILFTVLAMVTLAFGLAAQNPAKKPVPAPKTASTTAAPKTAPKMAPTPAAPTTPKTTKMDSLSYSFGILIAQNLIRQGVETIDGNSLAKGLEEGLKKMPQVEKDKAVEKANNIVQTAMQGMQAKKYEKTIAEGKEFLATNGKRAGVVTLPSGLQYEILTPGAGPKPKATDKVTVHYHGTLLNGSVFDSSVERGEPANFGVNQVIPGWVEGLQLMPMGSKWKLFIPSDLAYGERGAGQDIGPYSTLVFEVELIKIN
jgi:FKBP-type peptidyl-prolyl cis-trans isomerase FklB